MAVVDIIGMNATQHLLDADGPVIVDTGLFCPFQVGIGTIFHPLQGGLVVIETDGADGTSGVARLTRLGTRRVLAQQTTAGLFVDIQFLAHSRIFIVYIVAIPVTSRE